MNDQLDKQFYEFAVLFELRNALRSGDMWVVRSRKYKDFNEYLLDNESFNNFKIIPHYLVLILMTLKNLFKVELEYLLTT